ncbi:hypothetical protein GCM10023187_32210 [Nibrella viscosa]|uniref:Uncharacterized protein n=1 Tax=Nibrella viscosa TaxID=1084524 RepID=A0ABP8KLA8_9BACT
MTFWYLLTHLTLMLTTRPLTPGAGPGARLFILADTLPVATVPDSLARTVAEPDRQPYLRVVERPAESFMIHRISFVGDFLARLNYQETPTQQPFDSLSRLTYPRDRYIRMLFNEDDPRLNPRSDRYNPTYRLLADEFVTTVTTDTAAVFLPKNTEQLFGEVEYAVLYRNTPQKVRFYLKRHQTGSTYAWTLIDAEAPFLKNAKTDTLPAALPKRDTTARYLSSETHETQFLTLYNELSSRKNLLTISLEGYPVSKTLSRVARAFRDGSLSVQQTQQVHLYLDVRQGWVLKLTDFHREKDNAGWLITDLYNPAFRILLPAPIDRYRQWAVTAKKSN